MDSVIQKYKIQSASGCLLRIFFHVFYSSGKHKLDSVQLIYLAGARVVVNSNNICFRMPAADLLDHALAYNVVWQAAKG